MKSQEKNQSAKKQKVFAAMSGGVDSSVAALLLKQKKYDIIGVYMKGWLWNGPDASVGVNCAEDDARDARRVAGVLDIPFYVFDFENEFKKEVVDYMVSEYAAGHTPNPDVMCNREIKFGLFLKKALALGADYIATGHYTRLRRNFKFQISKLLTAKDLNKDQSYFLWTLTQNQLKHCLFPIGNYTKPQVRTIAKKYNLPTAEKPDSQGVCFVGEIDVAEFLKEKLGKNLGPIKTIDGKTIGSHDGAIFYTIGQRKGIGIKGSLPGEQGKIYYVAAKDVNTNTLWVGGGDSKNLFTKELSVKNINWVSGKAPKLPLKCLARIRYRQPLQKAELLETPISTTNRRSSENRIVKNPKSKILEVIFSEPQRAVTPGQSIVFYIKTGELIGGGIIE